MPTYVYRCECGETQEKFYRMADKPKTVPCPCGGEAISIPCLGGVLGDEPTWINDDLRGTLQKPGERPITNRTEYKRYLREHNIIER